MAKAPAPAQRSITGAPVAPVPQGTYRIKRGDTLIGIALDHGVSWRDLVAWNQLDNPNLIEVDQVLRVKPLPSERVTSVAGAAGTSVAGAVTTRPDAKSDARSAGSTEVRPITAGSSPPAAAGPAAKPAPTPPTVVATAPLTPPAVAAAGPISPAPAPAPAPAAPAPAAAAPPPGSTASSVSLSPPVSGAVASVEGVNWGWPGGGRVINQFADPGYKGIALSGAEGDPVVAASDGRVVYSGSGLRGYGNMVIVKHEADFLTAYAHNRTILVNEGQMVKRGQKIAELGKTDSDVPKLHFEVRKSGKPVDPMKFLPPR